MNNNADATHSWRWSYGIACMYGAAVLVLIVFFGEETYAFGFFDPPLSSRTLSIQDVRPEPSRSQTLPQTSVSSKG